MAPIPPIVVVGIGKHDLPLFSVEGAVLKRILLQEIATESRRFVFVGKEREPEVVVKLCNHQWTQNRLKLCFADTYSTKNELRRIH